MNTLCLLSFLLISCTDNPCAEKKITIEIINKLQECEENNLHYTVVNVNESDCKYIEGEIILPVLDSTMNTVENNNLLFPAQTFERIRLTVEGYYSKEQHSNIADGCIGSHSFKVVRILDKVKLDDEHSYPINNQ